MQSCFRGNRMSNCTMHKQNILSASFYSKKNSRIYKYFPFYSGSVSLTNPKESVVVEVENRGFTFTSIHKLACPEGLKKGKGHVLLFP